eukprot:TRINITY_DN10980_c0_g1_i1.p1 TRINITY_DN10980_c0_g1~~TRINITY_DN10980_c0_g1_i1.p1  ORF type:complete len:833 (-),score=184.48 TRINITY_DN10980_c0_g1_i1:282-2780(-)
MMHASIEEGRSPLTMANGGGSAMGNRAQLRARRVGRIMVIAVLIDAMVGPLVLLATTGFNVPRWFRDQVEDWSLSTSLADWLLLRSARDATMLGALLLRGIEVGFGVAGEPERDPSPLLWCRRAATTALLLWVMRIVMLGWNNVGARGFFYVPAMFESFSAIGLAMLAQLLVIFGRRARKERARSSQEAEASANGRAAGAPVPQDQQNSDVSYYGIFRVLKPYFWPSNGARGEILLNRLHAVSTWMFVAGSKVTNLYAPLFLAHATTLLGASIRQHGAAGGVPAGCTGYLVGYALLIFASKGLKEAQSLVYIRVQQAAYVEIADTTFAHLHSLSYEWHRVKKLGNKDSGVSGGVINRSVLRGMQAAQMTMQYLFLYLFPTFCETIAVTLIFIIHFRNLQLAVFMFVNLVAYSYLTIKVTLWRSQFRTATTQKDNELHERLTDSLTNFETVKCFTGEEYERTEYRKVVGKYQKFSMATQASLSLLNVAQQVIVNFALAGGMILAAARLVQEHPSSDTALGDFVGVNAYILNIFTPLNFLGTIYNMVVQAVVDMQSFGQLLAEKPEVQDAPNAGELSIIPSAHPMIEFGNVSFHYKTQPRSASLKEVNFRVPTGSSIAFVGHTGAGKTTITRLLLRFYDPISGHISVNGQDIRGVTQLSLRRAIGVVPQDVVMFNATIGHNIGYGRVGSATQADIERAAKGAQLADFIDNQEKSYDTVVGERGLKLSGGERQRLAIARCLVKDPAIVILDEATSALDTHTEGRVQSALAALSSNRTVVAIAHRLSTIRSYDQILVLESGQVIERGKHDELLAASSSKYAEMWSAQARGCAEDGA